MNSHATTYHLMQTPQPSVKSESAPLVITILGIVALVLIGAPIA
ncbi:MAG TPA: hypothetical protein VF587_17735 [Solirubrobacteraceae bacterium]